jgi:hypothetical protein
MDEKDKKIAELEAAVANLQRALRLARQEIADYQLRSRWQFSSDYDYIAHPDEEEYR